MIHIVEVGLSGSKAFKIITKEPELMVETIRDRLYRSATYNEVYGGYSREKFKEISCVINRLEESKMKELINEDPHFITVYDAEVKGGNFRNVIFINRYENEGVPTYWHTFSLPLSVLSVSRYIA